MTVEFDQHELLHLKLVAPQLVHITILSNSSLTCTVLKDCLSLVSPMRSDIIRLLVDFPSLDRVRWETASQSSSSLTLLSNDSVSSGTSVLGSFNSSSNIEVNNFLSLLSRLQDARLVLSPMGSLLQERLHRYIIQEGNMVLANLPQEGAGFSSEALQAILPPCGLMSGGKAEAWSSYLLGSHPDSANMVRRTWMDVSKECYQDSCKIFLAHGMQYGIRWKGPSLRLGQLVPRTSFATSCPWTSESHIEVTMPKSAIVEFPSGSRREDKGLLQNTLFSMSSLSFTQPLLTVRDGSTWSDIIYGRIDKTIKRPRGVAYMGQLETTVTNDDIYEAQVSLFDIVPSYVRINAIELSCPAVRSVNKIGSDSILMKHEFVLPPQSSVRLTVAYDPILLPFQHFPPDPNRGVEVPASWVVWNSTQTLYSHSLLLMPPVPDMSMPFNIISLTCTLYAFVIGSIINTIVRRGEDNIYFQLYPEKRPKSTGQKIREKLRGVLAKFLARKRQSNQDGEIVEKKEDELDPVGDDWIPEATVVDEANDVPFLLTQSLRQKVAVAALPVGVADRRWKRLYSLERDGDSFDAFIGNVTGHSQTVLVIETTRGYLFGGYAGNAWERRKEYFGSGQSCLFKIHEESVEVYKWSGENSLFQHINATRTRIIMGGGETGGFGLCVEDNFARGSTDRSETFDNKPLCPDHLFEVKGCEVYGFVHGTI